MSPGRGGDRSSLSVGIPPVAGGRCGEQIPSWDGVPIVCPTRMQASSAFSLWGRIQRRPAHRHRKGWSPNRGLQHLPPSGNIPSLASLPQERGEHEGTLANRCKTQPHRLRVRHHHGIHIVRIQTKKTGDGPFVLNSRNNQEGELSPGGPPSQAYPWTAKPRQWPANRVLAQDRGGYLLAASPRGLFAPSNLSSHNARFLLPLPCLFRAPQPSK